jgi:hypothetical protein
MKPYEVYWTTGRTDFRNFTVTFPDVRADASLNIPLVLDHKRQLDSLEYKRSAKTTKPPYSSLSMLVVVLVHLIVRSETALVA